MTRPLSNKKIIDMQIAMIERVVAKNLIENRLHKSQALFDKYGYLAKEYHDECITPIAELLEEQIKNFRELIADYIIEDLPQFQEQLTERKVLDEQQN